jgi:hypothetical protein
MLASTPASILNQTTPASPNSQAIQAQRIPL